ncbi:MAG: hypothetical protein MI923_08770 [Phycisphaerales bacterium]|nr:hypothetical protein [Phycisphaerales bacterium]
MRSPSFDERFYPMHTVCRIHWIWTDYCRRCVVPPDGPVRRFGARLAFQTIVI